MKVGILTIQDENYGNRLQNYALQTVLESLGHDVVSIQRHRPSLLRSIKRTARGLLKRDGITAIRQFNATYIHSTCEFVTSTCHSANLIEAFDKFVIGSDQIWNPTFPFSSANDYLPFVQPSKKVAYAASFGVSSLVKRENETANYLADIPFISVRERMAAELIKELIHRDVPVVLDPTMLLTTCDWEKVAKRPECLVIDGEYIFKYVLGKDVNREHINKVAEALGASVIDVYDPALKIGPSEFVWLISHCAAVCTDSFHASVFALLNHKPLTLFGRIDSNADMSSRFDTLLDLFDADRCRFGSEGYDMGCVDWDRFEGKLDKLRSCSINWLECALAGKDLNG